MKLLRTLPLTVFMSFVVSTLFGWFYVVGSTSTSDVYPPFPWVWVFIWTGILSAGAFAFLCAVKGEDE